ncbi:F-box/FBD/LRR-repeat protein At5g56420-like [Andrographis paniculata]|uniref:F-box/FBD/LRR-repeat protein At5g56420-like n=1 Tax=Andrographis paniculata TaxID=175694 RepID=UPI0021E7C330|nr:F-box/FBD/LRR-repeat protein At5g56420-like [Andrographis paniculata]
MKKRVRNLEPKGETDPRDYIDILPDDILVSILSRLTLKEAVITSVLSRRWRYLWTHVGGLDFDADDALDRVAADTKLRRSERTTYINWVNRVVRQHQRKTLNTVRICFDLDKGSKCAIENWVKFAIRKRVENLELDLLENGDTLRLPIRNYSFLNNHFGRRKVLSAKKGLTGFIPTGLKFLKALTLKCVNLTEQSLGGILSNCSVLHYLSVHGSGNLKNVKVSGLSLRLKHLEIVFCLGINTIEISNVKLVSFTYLGPGINLVLDNVPALDEISIGEGYSGLENNVFGQLSCCLYQLEVFTLDIYRPDENLMKYVFPELPNLKQLILKVGAWNDDSLLEFTSLVKACPNLNRFVLQLIWMLPSKRRRKIRRAAGCDHKHLNLVEIVGYYGRVSDDEIVVYFFENAASLKKVIIDPRNQILERLPVLSDQIKKQESARKRAKKQLEAKKPPRVELVIL